MPDQPFDPSHPLSFAPPFALCADGRTAEMVVGSAPVAYAEGMCAPSTPAECFGAQAHAPGRGVSLVTELLGRAWMEVVYGDDRAEHDRLIAAAVEIAAIEASAADASREIYMRTLGLAALTADPVQLVAFWPDGWGVVREGPLWWEIQPAYRPEDRRRLDAQSAGRAMTREEMISCDATYPSWLALMRALSVRLNAPLGAQPPRVAGIAPHGKCPPTNEARR